MNDPIDNYLDSLFDQARLEPLPVSANEIGSNLKITTGNSKKIFFTTHWKLMVLLVSGISVILVFFLTTSRPEPTSVNTQTTPKQGNIVTPLVEPTRVDQMHANTSVNKKPHKQKYTWQQTLVIPVEPTLFTSNNYATPSPNDDKGGLDLSYEELAKFHIYTNGCELKYTNLSDSIYTNRTVLRKRESKIFYYTEIQASGGSYTINNTVLGSDSILKVLSDSFMPSYPMFIEKEITFLEKKSSSQKEGDVITDMLELKAPTFIVKDFVEDAKKMLVPIRVELKAKANVYGRTDYDIIFWFKPNPEFCKLLPTDKANWVRQNYADYTDEKYKELIRSHSIKKQNRENQMKMDSVIYADDLSQALFLTDKHLKKLGFRKKAKGEIQYKICYQKKLIEVYGMESPYALSFNFIGNYGIMGTLRGINNKLLASFITDTGSQFYQLNKDRGSMHSFERYDENFQSRQVFKEQKSNLIPVLVQCKRKDGKPVNWYFWFPKTDAFFETIGQKKKN